MSFVSLLANLGPPNHHAEERDPISSSPVPVLKVDCRGQSFRDRTSIFQMMMMKVLSSHEHVYNGRFDDGDAWIYVGGSRDLKRMLDRLAHDLCVSSDLFSNGRCTVPAQIYDVYSIAIVFSNITGDVKDAEDTAIKMIDGNLKYNM